jgi:hypothetical protein
MEKYRSRQEESGRRGNAGWKKWMSDHAKVFVDMEPEQERPSA